MGTGSDLYRSFGAISVASSGAVVLTGLLFPKVMISPKRLFPHILFFISVCDMIASWIWTFFLVYQLRYIIIDKSIWLTVTRMHIFCWTTSLFLVFIPLLMVNYGVTAEYNGKAPCTFGGRSNTLNRDWTFFEFYCFLLLCFSFMSAFTIEVLIHMNTPKGSFRSEATTSVYGGIYKSMRIYPIGMFITWFPALIFSFVGIAVHYENFSIAEPFYVLASQYGTVLGIAFFVKTKQARENWKKLLFNIFGVSGQIRSSELSENLLSELEGTGSRKSSAIYSAASGSEIDDDDWFRMGSS